MIFNLIFLLFAVSQVTAGNTFKRPNQETSQTSNDLKWKSFMGIIGKSNLNRNEMKKAKSLIKTLTVEELNQQE